MSRLAWRAQAALLAIVCLAGCVGAPRPSSSELWAPRDPLPSRTFTEASAILGVEADCRRSAARCPGAIADAPGPLQQATREYALAEAWFRVARGGRSGADDAALHCAAHAHRYLFAPMLEGRASALEAIAQQALRLYNECARLWLVPRVGTPEGLRALGPDWAVRTESYPLARIVGLEDSRVVPVDGFRTFQRQDGIGVTLVARTRDDDAPAAAADPRVLPVTALLRFDVEGPLRPPSVELHDGFAGSRIATALGEIPLAVEFTPAYARWAATLPGPTAAVLELANWYVDPVRPRVDLLQPYDPVRVPVILIHGLGSGPNTWLNLANDLLGDPRLGARYQVWVCRYPTALPLLANRQALVTMFTQLLTQLDPASDDPGPRNVVLIGHSMGGVLARMLVSGSGDGLWQAAFAVAPDELNAAPEDRAAARALFYFEPWTPATRAILLAAPHRGSPTAASWVGRVAGSLVRLPPEAFGYLVRIAQSNPEQVRALLRNNYLEGGPKSIDTLSPTQPVIVASAALPTDPRVRVHQISGVKDPDVPEPGDGVVPLWSTEWPSADSRLVVRSGHDVHKHPASILEIKRILLEHATPPTAKNPPQ